MGISVGASFWCYIDQGALWYERESVLLNNARVWLEFDVFLCGNDSVSNQGLENLATGPVLVIFNRTIGYYVSKDTLLTISCYLSYTCHDR